MPAEEGELNKKLEDPEYRKKLDHASLMLKIEDIVEEYGDQRANEVREVLRAALGTAVECGDTQRKRIEELEVQVAETREAALEYTAKIFESAARDIRQHSAQPRAGENDMTFDAETFVSDKWPHAGMRFKAQAVSIAQAAYDQGRS